MLRHLKNTLSAQILLMGLALLLAAAPALADPLPGRNVLKFSQRPLDNISITGTDGTTTAYFGHDELSTAYSTVDPLTGTQTVYRGQFMADDFADRFDSPVVHVKWWGSYLNNSLSPVIPVDRFLISFERDVPADPDDPALFSHPGEPLLNQIVRRGPLAPSSGTFIETPFSPGGPPAFERLYEYNAELHVDKEFFQKPDEVYWLKIVALVDLPPGFNPGDAGVPEWGWHDRDYTLMDPLASVPPAVVPGEHIQGTIGPAPFDVPVWHFQDDAVTGRVEVDPLSTPNGQIMPLVYQDPMSFQSRNYIDLVDGPQGIGDFSKDLAFELYTVPEPASALVGIVALSILGLRPSRRRRS